MRTGAYLRIKRVSAHVLFWVAYIYYQGIIYDWQDRDELHFVFNLHIGGLPILITILLTYFNLLVLLPAFYFRRRYVSYVFWLVISLFTGAVFTRLLTHYFILPWEQMHDTRRYLLEVKRFWIPSRIIRLAIQYYPAIAIVTVFELMRKNTADERRLRELEAARSAAEMNFLKAQVNPHFLFNTLNSLYALVLKNAEEAGRMVLRLSGLMRYMLLRVTENKVFLREEIDQLSNYLGIEKLRFADRFELSFQCTGETEELMVMPLVLLPFAENAFKHGVDEGGGWVTIDLKIVDNVLSYFVENSKSLTGAEGSGGIGLANLRRRLELAYPGRYELTVQDRGDVFQAILRVEL